MARDPRPPSVDFLLDVVQGRLPERSLLVRALDFLRSSDPEFEASYRGLEGELAAEPPPDPEPPPLEPPAEPSDGEIAAAREHLRRLIDLSAAEAVEAVGQNRGRYRSPVLVDLLLTEARQALSRSPHEALDLLRVARAVADRLPRRPPPHPEAAAAERRELRVAAHQANALRVAGELVAADAAPGHRAGSL